MDSKKRAVPRGPMEWGRLLYEPQWAIERKYSDGRDIYMNIVILAMGVILVGIGLVMAIEAGGFALMLSAIGIVLVMMGYGMYRSQVTNMPFRMYERGFTQTTVPFSQGYRRKEVLVYYEMLEKVSVDTSSFQGISLNHLQVDYTGPGGSTKEMALSFNDPDNPLDVMVAFRTLVPDKVDHSLDAYVGPGAEDAAIPVPFEDRQGSTTHDVSGIVMSTGMMIFVAVLTGLMLGGFDMHPIGLAVSAPLQIILYLVFLGLASTLAVRGFKSSVGDSAKVAGDVLTLPRSSLYNLYADTRSTIPLVEVREARKALDTMFFGHKALLVTAAGEKVQTRHALWQVLREHPMFEQEGFVLRNRRPFTGQAYPLVRVNRWKCVAVAMTMMLLAMVIGLTMGGGSDSFFDAWDKYSPYVIMVMLGVLVPIVIILRVLIAKRSARGEGIMSSDMGLMMPGKDGSPHWISQGEIRSAIVKKDLLGPYIELTTVGGIEKLPLSAAPKLESADVHVEDDLGILTSVPRPADVDMVPPPLPGMDRRTGEPERRPRVSGRGMLISEMPDEKVASERQKAKVFGTATVVGSIVAGAALWAFPWLLGDSICSIFVGIMVVFLGVLGVILLVASRRLGPVRVYENGVEWVSIAKGPHFIGWGDFTTASESEFSGKRMVTLTRDNRPAGSITADVPGYDEWLPMILERVNDPAYASEEEDEGEPATYYWAVPMALLAVSMVLGIATAAYAGDDLSENLTVSGWEFLILLGMTIALGYFFVLMGWMMRRQVFGLAKARFPTVALTIPVAVMLLVYFVALSTAGPVTMMYTVDIQETDDPGRTVLETGEYTNTNITADGPVTVGAGETLTLFNVTLTFDPAPGLDYGVWVHPDGTLLMDDVLITSADPDVGFSFEVHGKGVILNSRIVGTASDPDNVNGEGGVELYCADVRVENTLFENALSAALMTVYCSPTIRNCTFTGALDEGIEVHGGSPVIEGCTFVECEWPIILWNGSEAEIANCTFEDCPRGIDLSQSSATIRDCTFRNIEEYAIQWTSDTSPEPTLEGNTFDNVGTETDVQAAWLSMGSICVAVTIITAIIGTAALLLVNRKRPERVPLEPRFDQFG